MVKSLKRVLLTPGEPAGIGPDICISIAQRSWPAEIVVVADPELLAERSVLLGQSLTLVPCEIDRPPEPNPPGTLKYIPIPRLAPTIPGQLNLHNSAYVIETLKQASQLCLTKKADALVTGPVQKSALNVGGFAFRGHTEFLARCANVAETLMTFVSQPEQQAPMIVALTTTHLPLQAVSAAITPQKLQTVIQLLHQGLQQLFNIENPHILVCGLNPHAGESGYLGYEEGEVISPVIQDLQSQGLKLSGPYSADTIFLPQQRSQGDAILAMYHDQALPVVKYASFGHAVNLTLGLPFIRTSVDHGTALALAGTGQADASSLEAALNLAIQLCLVKH